MMWALIAEGLICIGGFFLWAWGMDLDRDSVKATGVAAFLLGGAAVLVTAMIS